MTKLKPDEYQSEKLQLRLSVSVLSKLDEICKRVPGKALSRAEAIRRLVERAYDQGGVAMTDAKQE